MAKDDDQPTYHHESITLDLPTDMHTRMLVALASIASSSAVCIGLLAQHDIPGLLTLSPQLERSLAVYLHDLDRLRGDRT